jgi:hypothetical protein
LNLGALPSNYPSNKYPSGNRGARRPMKLFKSTQYEYQPGVEKDKNKNQDQAGMLKNPKNKIKNLKHSANYFPKNQVNLCRSNRECFK